jgi:hypothetical protein
MNNAKVLKNWTFYSKGKKNITMFFNYKLAYFLIYTNLQTGLNPNLH